MRYILCTTRPSVYVALDVREGEGVTGGLHTPHFFCYFLCLFLVVFRHMVFTDCFLILVKELGLLSNSG
jgi:hypothetical protein